jgi:hypothetical protein
MFLIEISCIIEFIKEFVMNSKLREYGVTIVNRPPVPATKKLDLSGEHGKQIVKSETKLALRTHKRTFDKLADM